MGNLDRDRRAMRPACRSTNPHTNALEIQINEKGSGAVYMVKGKQRWEKEAVGRRLLPKEEGRRRGTLREAGRRHD
jgi:hypothetical protein